MIIPLWVILGVMIGLGLIILFDPAGIGRTKLILILAGMIILVGAAGLASVNLADYLSEEIRNLPAPGGASDQPGP